MTIGIIEFLYVIISCLKLRFFYINAINDKISMD